MPWCKTSSKARKSYPIYRCRAPARVNNKALAASTIYKFDVERAKKLMAEAGWKAGADGVLANGKGEKMEFEFRVTAERRDHEQAQAIIADYWKRLGVRTNIKNMPNRLLNSADNRNRWPGAYIGSHNVTVEEWPERFHSQEYSDGGKQVSRRKTFPVGTIPRRTPSSTISTRSSRLNNRKNFKSSSARCLAPRCRTCRYFLRRKFSW